MRTRNLLSLALLILFPACLLGADNSLDQLRDRFKQRHPQILKLKQDGIIGETAKGYVDFVKDKSANDAHLVDAENADRKQLYEALAKKLGTTPEKVAERNAIRNFDRAEPGEWLQHVDGTWHQKQ